MAQEEIKFSIADNGQSATPNDGANVDLIVTYDPTMKNSDGAYIITNASGTIQRLSATGQVVGTDTITGLAPASAPVSVDNELFIQTDPNAAPIVTSEGFAFTINNTADTLNGNGDTPGYIKFYDKNGDAAGFPHNDTPAYGLNAFDDNGNPPTGLTETAVTCFATGTLNRTTRGDVAVEELVAGDRAVTGSGESRPIVWIGHREMTAGKDGAAMFPVRVSADAFGAGLPERDLSLSPGHPILVGADEDGLGGHLVPVMCLVNGTSIVRVPVERVTYWHVELDAHDILLAENLPAESYLDWGDRGFFTEGSDHALTNPDFVVPGLAARCRPVVLDGPVVAAERTRLDRLFDAKLSDACAWPLAETIAAFG